MHSGSPFASTRSRPPDHPPDRAYRDHDQITPGAATNRSFSDQSGYSRAPMHTRFGGPVDPAVVSAEQLRSQVIALKDPQLIPLEATKLTEQQERPEACTVLVAA